MDNICYVPFPGVSRSPGLSMSHPVRRAAVLAWSRTCGGQRHRHQPRRRSASFLRPAAGGTNAEFRLRIIRQHRDRYRTELTDPAVLDAIGDVADLDILDAGCGEGYMTRELASRGAHQVNGIDTSRELVKAAEAAMVPGTSFSEASAGDLPFPRVVTAQSRGPQRGRRPTR
jgi:SAM-dependent methyltransferase